MGALTIRNLDDSIKERLRLRAARHGHSMEEEVRQILKRSVEGVAAPDLWNLSRELFSGKNGVDLDLPSRKKDRKAPIFKGVEKS